MDKPVFCIFASFCGPDYLLRSASETIYAHGQGYHIFAVGKSYRKFVNKNICKAREAHNIMYKLRYPDIYNIVNAPCGINLANYSNPKVLKTSKWYILKTLYRARAFKASKICFYPGFQANNDREKAKKCFLNSMAEILEYIPKEIGILLIFHHRYTNGLGRSLIELKEMIDKINNKRVQILISVDSLYANQYDFNSSTALVDRLENEIGLDNIYGFIVNDTELVNKSLKTYKPRNVGLGEIGFQKLRDFIYEPRLQDKIFYLKTPKINNKQVYRYEIKMLQASKFVPGLYR